MEQLVSFPASPMGRPPLPWNLEAEEATIGSLLIHNSGMAEVPFLNPKMFYRERHRFVMEGIVRLWARGEPFDPVTLTDELERIGVLQEAGGPAAITDLFMRVPTAIHLQYYARIVERCYILRELVGAAEKIARMAYEEGEAELPDLLNRVEDTVFGVSQLYATHTFPQTLGQLMAPAQARYDLYQSGNHPDGIPTASPALNRLLLGGGLRRRKLTIIAARPKIGKTTRVLWDMWHQVQAGYVVLFFSLEMDAESVADKLVAMGAKVDSSRMVSGTLNGEEYARVQAFTHNTATSLKGELVVCDQRHLSPMQMEAAARWVVKRHGRIDVMVADHLQEMGDAGLATAKRRASTNDITGEKTRAYRNLQHKYNSAGVLVSQLSRGVDQREDKRPQPSDLRDSGGIEESADTVIFIYRDEYYHKNTNKPGIAEMIVSMQRGGPTGTVEQYVDLATGRWGDIDYRAAEPPPLPSRFRESAPLPPPLNYEPAREEYDDVIF
jgi:replicative DNA helicase